MMMLLIFLTVGAYRRMEYSQIEDTVARIQKGDVEEQDAALLQGSYASDGESAYRQLMKHEKDALRVAERVADDKRSGDIRAGSLWNTPLSKVFSEFVDFWRSLYMLIMDDKVDQAAQRLLTPDGLVSGGIAILGVAVLLCLLRI